MTQVRLSSEVLVGKMQFVLATVTGRLEEPDHVSH
jgi:hypothetical protein